MRKLMPLVIFVLAFIMTGCGQTGLVRNQEASLPKALPKIIIPGKVASVSALDKGLLYNGTESITITFSSQIATTTPQASFTPNVQGSWQILNNQETFTPASGFLPCRSYKLVIPQTTQVKNKLLHTVIRDFNVACPQTGLKQALAYLGYLPYKLKSTSLNPTQIIWQPQVLHKSIASAPSILDQNALKGAIMSFQSQNNLTFDGNPGKATWTALVTALQKNHRISHPYTWVTVSEEIPETLEVHVGGRIKLTTAANTGVPGAETQTGVYPIFSRFTSTTMSGTEPDGSTYVDPGVPWVNYFNGGDAVHGFPRASYGTPQSNGCVELPIPTSQKVFYMLHIGDLVLVHS